MRKTALFILILVGGWIAWSALAGERQSAQPQYAGAEVCFVCHIDFARKWGEVSHSKTLMDKERPADQRGCEACHGPGSVHVAGTRKQILGWKKLSPAAQNDLCLKCHQGKVEAGRWKPTVHAELEMVCVACHEVHKPVEQEHLLKQPALETCNACHGGMAEQVEAKTHHPIPEGFECSTCHNFHGTENERLLVAPQQDLCALCHDPVPKPEDHARAEWRLKHLPEAKEQQDQCLMCHSQTTFCHQCHVVKVPHPEGFVTDHGPTAKEHRPACLNCHAEEYCTLCHETVPG